MKIMKSRFSKVLITLLGLLIRRYVSGIGNVSMEGRYHRIENTLAHINTGGTDT
jgi:hypothetical protein